MSLSPLLREAQIALGRPKRATEFRRDRRLARDPRDQEPERGGREPRGRDRVPFQESGRQLPTLRKTETEQAVCPSLDQQAPAVRKSREDLLRVGWRRVPRSI